MLRQVYHSRDIQAWEQRWFAHQNSAYGLMQQVAWLISQQLNAIFAEKHIQSIAVCCGQGNNAGDGFLVAKYLKQFGFDVTIYASETQHTISLQQAYTEAKDTDLTIFEHFNFQKTYDAYIDALFGIGLNRALDQDWQHIIAHINACNGLKIALDIPSGLDANTGIPLPCAIQADYTFTVLGLKAGVYTGKGKQYSGEIRLVSPIPPDQQLSTLASITDHQIHLPKREAFGHKGSYGHVLIVGGHADMGGAVIMAAEAAFASGAGKVTVVCDVSHHMAILARSPNIMLKDINSLSIIEIQNLIEQIDTIALGMGLGRNDWSEKVYKQWFPLLLESEKTVILDADALWFLAKQPKPLHENICVTPHPGEAAKLLGITVREVESDRIQAIYELEKKYKGQWVLKGAGSLILEHQVLWICTAGNPGMGTGGMGDVLSGMIASLKAQFQQAIALHEVVTLHALAGDELAKTGQRGLQAQQMSHAIYIVMNKM